MLQTVIGMPDGEDHARPSTCPAMSIHPGGKHNDEPLTHAGPGDGVCAWRRWPEDRSDIDEEHQGGHQTQAPCAGRIAARRGADINRKAKAKKRKLYAERKGPRIPQAQSDPRSSPCRERQTAPLTPGPKHPLP